MTQPLIENTTVKLHLDHNILSARIPEVRLDLFMTIAQVKQLCEKKFGSNSEYMQLVLQDNNGNNVCTMAEDDRNLGFYSPQDFYTIYVIDTNPNSLIRELEDLSQVEKYVMKDEDYDKLPINFRKFKKQFLLQHPELFQKQQNANQALDADYQKDIADQIQVGNRCKLKEQGHRGTVKFVGKIKELSQGFYVGVQLDEPFGKNNGVCKGTTYFECQNNYGLFLRPDKIEVGDFPELDLEDEI